MKNAGRFLIYLAVILLFLVVSVWLAGYFMNKRMAMLDKIELLVQQSDSLKLEYKVLKQSYDSLVAINLQNEKEYAAQLVIDRQKMKQYKLKIREYEKAIDDIGTMSDDELISLITEYYRKYAGFNPQ
jgi:hypothetical protein